MIAPGRNRHTGSEGGTTGGTGTALSRIDVEHLEKRFDDKGVVRDISFSVPHGTLCVLLGPSGCGKSTTLRLIAGLEDPSGGRILIGGTDVTHLPAKDRRIAMVFQSYALFPHLNVADNILFGLQVRRVDKGEQQRRLQDVAALTGLSDYLARKPGQLSGGQRQRVALARAIVSEQPVCLMDEPLSNLDAKLRNEMRLEIRALQQRLAMTMVYVTHDQIEAMTMADHVILMNDGVIEQAGAPDDLYERPASLFAARFIGAPPMNLFRDRLPGKVIGVRAEHLLPAPPGDGPGDVVVASVEYLGADAMLSVRPVQGVAAEPVFVRVPGSRRARTGERLSLSWDPAHEHHFDAATGRRLDRGAVRAEPLAKTN
jgi:sn-glycerol 3-phosphate transport system ATP-binding protein